LWSLPDGTLLKNLKSNILVKSIAFSPDSTLLASATGGSVDLWSLPDGTLLKSLNGHWGEVDTVAISPDGTLLASGDSNATIGLWNLPEGNLLLVPTDPTAAEDIDSCTSLDESFDTCSCNAVCSCDQVCTCEKVCACDTVCSCQHETSGGCGGYYFPG
jgi:WD40 repeat protein